MVLTVANISRKRATLRSRITTLETAVAQGKIDQLNAKLRLARLTEVFKDYEALNDELALLDPENEGLNQMDEIQDSYYAIASKVETMLGAQGSAGGSTRENNSTIGTPLGNSTIIEKQRFVKLPTADLPKFDGDYENWLSFKNTFLTMIDARTDVDDLNKFLYLRGSLTGPAFNKLALFTASAENYKRAWKHLVQNYEKKRVLIAKHCDALIDISPATRATTESLNKIVDESRQHMEMLKSLGSTPEDVIVRLMERKLPTEVRKKWEESLTLDAFPTHEEFCKFVSESAYRIVSFKQGETHGGKDASFRKRHTDRTVSASKFRKVDSNARVLVTTAFSTCVQCRSNHPLFKCPTFAAMSVNQRLDVVNKNRLCRNCLREHKGPCISMRCKNCNRFHHTLLHFKTSSKNFVPKQTATKTEAVEVKPSA